MDWGQGRPRHQAEHRCDPVLARVHVGKVWTRERGRCLPPLQPPAQEGRGTQPRVLTGTVSSARLSETLPMTVPTAQQPASTLGVLPADAHLLLTTVAQ